MPNAHDHTVSAAPRKPGVGKRPPTVVSLFSGCGGLDLGFQNAGFDLLYACDSDPAAVNCYQRNVDPRATCEDVRSEAFHKALDDFIGCDVVLGGFPCQGFSKAGPKAEVDERNLLYLEMKRAVEKLRPRIFIGENVDGVAQNFSGAFLERIRSDFAEVGYKVDYRILDAASYGLPQYRRRLIIVGTSRKATGEFSWPAPTHQAMARNGEKRLEDPREPTLFGGPVPALLPTRTIGDAIEDLLELDAPVPDHQVSGRWPEKYNRIFERIGEGQKLCNVRHAPSSVYTWEVPEVFGPVTERERTVLVTISRHRRHKRYGDIPNGNPLPVAEIERLSGLKIGTEIEDLLAKNYLKPVRDGYDLKGAMFCSGLFKRPLWDEPSPTVLTNFHNPRYFLHPRRDRPFTLREAARLQGFSDTFTFVGGEVSLVDGYRLVGNAVPPPLAYVLAYSVMASFTEDADMHAVAGPSGVVA